MFLPYSLEGWILGVVDFMPSNVVIWFCAVLCSDWKEWRVSDGPVKSQVSFSGDSTEQ